MKRFSKIAALFLGLVLTFGFVSCETEADNSLALAALALSSGSSGAVNPSTENTCTITFDANGGSITTATQTVTAGEKTALKSATELGLSRTNYAFVGWATKSDAASAEYNDAAEVTLSADLTLYALWSENTCKITFDANGGTITTASQVVKSGVKATLKSADELGLSRTNYAFVGWATKSGATTAEYADGAEVTLSDNLTLYAIWNELPVNEQPLTLEFINSGTITITNRWSSLKYSINGGDLTDATDSITVATGDKVCFYAQKSENGTYYQIINCDADCYIYGNIMSLVTLTENGDWNPLETTLFGEYSFNQLFYKNCHIKNHASKKLILPATELTRNCYCEMFKECTSLTAAPSLPAETLADGCYSNMFAGCTSLTTAPELPAETLAAECYSGMFYGCTSLTTAPELKATTLAEYCCNSMFYGCTSLTIAPELKATTLEGQGCYAEMFYGCTSLRYVKCLATNIYSTWCTDDWLKGVSASGTFVKAKDMSWESGASGIPIGWTVEDAE